MSNSVEERVVEMKLNNKDFESNAKKSLSTLGELADKLKLTDAAKGLVSVASAAKNLIPSSAPKDVDNLASRFSALSVIGVTALATIANKAVNAGIQLAKSLTVGPIGNGFSDYNEKLTSVQTIMNATGKSLTEVNGYFKQLDTYADQTIYNLSDMTGALAKFVNAGIDLKKAVPAIKGIANMTALAGQGAGAASIAMYNLSQSLAGGFLTTTDYKSLNLANVATKQWKDYMIQSAVAAGTLKKVGRDAYHIAGTKAGTASTAAALFNEKLSEGWATSKVLLKVLGDYGNPLTAIGRKALAAAQDVKSLPMMMDTLKAGVGTGWTDTFEIVLGNLKESKALFTGLTNYVGTFLGKMQDNRNKMLTEWKKAGGRNALIDGLKNSFQALLSVIKPIKDAFNQIFPPMTGKRLAELTKNFRDFAAGLKMGPENMDRLKRTFAGVFAIFKVGYTIISGVVSTLFNLFGIAKNGSGGILALTAAVGDFIVKIQEWLVTNGKIKEFFSTINTARAAIFVPLIAILSKVAEAFGALLSGDFPGFIAKIKQAFGGLGALADGIWKSMTANVRNLLANLRDATGIAGEFLKSLGIKALEPLQNMLSKLSENFGKLRLAIQNLGLNAFKKGSEGAAKGASVLAGAGEQVKAAWEQIKQAFEAVRNFLGPVGDSIGNLFTTITDKIAEFIKNLDMQDAIAVVNTGFFILMYKSIRDFMKNMDGFFDDFKGIGQAIKDSFGSIGDTLKSFSETMEKQVKINAILKIAVALGILALSLKLISTIDTGKLAMSLGAIGAMMLGLTFSMKSLMGMMEVVEGQTPVSAGRVLAASAGLVLMAGAILLLASAVKKIASLSWEEMARGLIGTAALIGALALYTKFAEMDSGSLKAGANLILLAGAIYLISFAVSKLGNMDTGQLVKGVAAVVVLIGAMAGMSAIMSKFGAGGVAAIVAMAGALALLAPIIVGLGLIPYEVLGKGLGTIAIALGLLAGASQLMAAPTTVKGAVAIATLAGSLAVLAPVLALLGTLPYKVLAKGLGTIAIALGLLAIAANLMGGPMALSGSIGIIAIAGALMMLAPVILLLGQADLKTLAIGLGAMAVALGIFIVAGAAAMYVAPGLFALGTAILMIGGAMLLAGVGFAAFAAGFATLVAIGTAGFAVLTVGFSGLLNLIPLFAQQVGLGIIAIAVVISKSGPRIIDAITVVLISFLAAIQRAAPQFFSTMTTLILGLIRAVTTLIPVLASRGAQMILRLLTVIQGYIPQFARKATDIMLAFINAIATNVPRLVDGGMKAVIALINGVANSIRSNSAALNAAGRNLASAIVEGMVNGITGGLTSVVNAAKGLAKSALNAAKSALGIHSPSREFAKLGKFSVEGFAKGLHGNKAAVDAAMKSMRDLVKETQTAIAKDVADATARLAKLNKARKKDYGAIKKAKADLAQAKAEQKKVNAANALLKTYGDEQKKLGGLANSYDAVTKKLDDARKVLADATKTRDDYAKSVQDQYDKLPDFNKETKLDDFVANLEKQVVDTQLYTAQLQKLRELGLNDEMYKQLLAKGPEEGMAFAQQLLEGGKTAVDQINTLGSALDKAAKDLGNSASKALYQAAVDSAAGLVKGLEAQQKALAAQMDKLADAMVNAIKKKLGIKSPSRVFMKVGDWSVKGLAKGLKDSSSITEKAAEQVGHGTIEAMRKTLSGLPDAMSEVDVDPTIRPVLDLTQVQADAVKMGALFGDKDIQVGSAFKSAKIAAAEHAANKGAQDEFALAGAGDSFSFTQINNSPKALSEATIYRQTKNQISTAKGALKN